MDATAELGTQYISNVPASWTFGRAVCWPTLRQYTVRPVLQIHIEYMVMDDDDNNYDDEKIIATRHPADHLILFVT